MTSTDLLTRADVLRHGRTPFVLATVVRVERPTSAKPGDGALVLPDGTVEGFVGGTCAELTVQQQGLRVLKTGESLLLRITPTTDAEAERAQEAGEGLMTVANPCLSGGTLDIFLEANLPPPLAYVYGEAPIARALLDIGRVLGFDVRPASPRQPLPPDLDVVAIAMHGRDEGPVVKEAVRAGVPYIGLVASPKRGTALLDGLGLTEQQRTHVHTPAGLDIGARTPPEVALSVYAEVIALRPRAARDVHPEADADTAQAEAVDPVCGMTVAITSTTLSLDRDGTRVYFCGPGCRHAFTDDPSRYAHD
ncbi:cytochrome oxidase I [Streptomyces pluripotens]|uniref:Cytochrome oxidase I n=1 Tax=Streptomyces pluripotens TaxID=1355015 RepID=A0A221NS45_9ACTN|nr:MULTISPECIES: XdhC family protein [Streptomyces]ASN22764.1 cytochrome oxidase I [Streptomyces pluripotens]KIE25440.1 cytochrome oxidase I [Streptomyces sp. MUSC 125]MCH0558149.1 XdhC family protein [Streptomyces sp. MUM 16J]